MLLGCRCLLAAPAGCVCYACAEAEVVIKDPERELTLPEQEPITPAAVDPQPILTEVAERQPIVKEISEPQPIGTEPVVHEQEKPDSTRPVKMVQLCEVEKEPQPPCPGEYLVSLIYDKHGT